MLNQTLHAFYLHVTTYFSLMYRMSKFLSKSIINHTETNQTLDTLPKKKTPLKSVDYWIIKVYTFTIFPVTC